MRTLTAMRTPVRHQMPLAHEILFAQITTEWTIRRCTFIMGTLMKQQVTLQWERFPTFRTSERSFASMRSHMINQVLLASKRFRANIATMRCFTGMLSQMIR